MTSIMAEIYTSTYSSPYPIKKVGDFSYSYPYPYPVNARISRQNKDNTSLFAISMDNKYEHMSIYVS